MVYIGVGRNQDRTEFKVVGQRGIPGRFSYPQATGLAKFDRDLTDRDNLPGMLHAKFLRSPYARARIKSMDISAAQALPGVKAVVKWDDPEIKGKPFVAVMAPPANILGNEAFREGDEVGVCVAAESEEICDEALKLIKVEWEVLPHILDPREAVKPDAPILRSDLNLTSNVGGEDNWEDGNVEAGFKEADNIIEYDLSWGRACNFHAHPVVAIAKWEQESTGDEGEALFIGVPAYHQLIGVEFPAREFFNLPEDKIHALAMYWGGQYCDFGGRRSYVMAPLLAKRTGKPVRMANTRRDNFDDGGSSNYAHVKIGFKNDGTLTAAYGNIVIGVGANMYGLGMTMMFFRTTKCPNIKQDAKFVYTSTALTCADQGVFLRKELLAKAFWLIADKLGMDPTEVALKNCHTPEPSLKLCIDKGKAAIGWNWHAAGAKKLPNGKMHGYGFRYHDAYGHGRVVYNCALSIKTDGKVYMPINECCFGTHWEDACAMVIAEELGAKIEDVIIQYSKDFAFWFQGTAADRGPSGAWVAKEAAIDLKATLLENAARVLNVKPEELDTKDSTVYLKADPTKSYPFKQFAFAPRPDLPPMATGQLAACFIGSPPHYDEDLKTLSTMNTAFCEVEVDTETGQVEITKWVSAVDAGKMIRPSSYEGQLEGQVIQGIGYSMFEEVIYDKATGVLLNGSALDYKPPTVLDVPPIVMPTAETRIAKGCYGATGMSHCTTDRGIVSQAVYNAIGKWIDIPITPDKVLKALGKI